MNFDVAGPFELERERVGKAKILTRKTTLPALREELKKWGRKWGEGLESACGCYVFALRTKGITPYYVGQACRSALLEESLNSSNITKYNHQILSTKGTPIIFFLPMMTPSGRYRKRKKAGGALRELDFLEDVLISAAIEKNPKLINNKRTLLLRELTVTGIYNRGRGDHTSDSRALCKALW